MDQMPTWKVNNQGSNPVAEGEGGPSLGNSLSSCLSNFKLADDRAHAVHMGQKGGLLTGCMHAPQCTLKDHRKVIFHAIPFMHYLGAITRLLWQDHHAHTFKRSQRMISSYLLTASAQS
eukprot:1155627-Pelagomonas_calceolata.AAC.3